MTFPSESMETIAETKNLTKKFPMRGGAKEWILRRKVELSALRDVSVTIPRGMIVGLVGESGSGKTTLGRILGGLEPASGGEVRFNGVDTYASGASAHRRVQFVFQDPWSAVNPRFTIFRIIEEPLLLAGHEPSERIESVREALRSVGLPSDAEFMGRYPWELSGGQLQRVAFARATISKPELIIADEPVSMLDVSLRIGLLNLILELRERHKISFLFITHDLAQALYVSDYLYVLYLGEVMEEGPTRDVIARPLNPYTLSLMKSVLKIDSEKVEPIKGEVPSPVRLPSGCSFHSRCPIATEVCSKFHPELTPRESGRLSRCLLR